MGGGGRTRGRLPGDSGDGGRARTLAIEVVGGAVGSADGDHASEYATVRTKKSNITSLCDEHARSRSALHNSQ